MPPPPPSPASRSLVAITKKLQGETTTKLTFHYRLAGAETAGRCDGEAHTLHRMRINTIHITFSHSGPPLFIGRMESNYYIVDRNLPFICWQL